jgi:hypothetical protein
MEELKIKLIGSEEKAMVFYTTHHIFLNENMIQILHQANLEEIQLS